jgi:hypothetical protein
MLLFLNCILIAFNLFPLHLICCLHFLPIHFQHTLHNLLIYRQLWMLPDGVMRGGCTKSVMHRGMINKLIGSFNRMRKKKNVTDGRKIDCLLGDSKDWEKWQTTLPDRTSQIMRISSHHLRIPWIRNIFPKYLLLPMSLLPLFHLHLSIPQFHLLFPWHDSHLTQIGLCITWEKWMLNVWTVGLCIGNLRCWKTLHYVILNLACAVSVERLKSQDSMFHHQSFSIFSQGKRIYARNFVNVFGIITMHWQ